jgi:integrase
MDHHLKKWIDFLRHEVYARDLRPEDLIFPSVDKNGTSAAPRAPMSLDTIQRWIDKIVVDTGLNMSHGRFTTHCFRRGGAQFHFMYAQKKWPLRVCRWWGGWSEGEKVCIRDLHNVLD